MFNTAFFLNIKDIQLSEKFYGSFIKLYQILHKISL